ncbi:hypothetical protein [Persicirhabdus sediminis]|uniref:Uncharacterized protein n=1 Tax=Persicirhabdus sediminis TaxID=454144 RepID=A0A8J7SJM6_9BACT|nr:hypothetical protein [Persicirhabdus sediminis]MBK1792255.1 hypothetical protein [Persicirhabdus sediminis]
MSSLKPILWGFGIFFAICLLAIVSIGLLLNHSMQDVEGVDVTLTNKTNVQVGETFDLVITVTNERPEETLDLSDIDIYHDYLDGFTVADIQPKPKSTMGDPFGEFRTFTFASKIPPGASKDFTFTLQAQQAGIFRGDVDICEDLQFVTSMAQTVVTEAE